MKWLRAQPDVTPRGPNYDPSNLSTWPWADKIERTLTTSAADVDALIDEVADLRQEMRLRPFG